MIVAPSVDAFDLQGHRGARGLAPENTLAAFAMALEIGVTTLETDLAVTSDGVLVLSHDPVLNPHIVRGADGSWLSVPGPAINALTLAQLKRFDVGRIDPSSRYARQFPGQKPADGERIPALAELFELVRRAGKGVRFNIETKVSPDKPAQSPDPDTFARLVVEAIRAAGPRATARASGAPGPCCNLAQVRASRRALRLCHQHSNPSVTLGLVAHGRGMPFSAITSRARSG